ncbi:E3 ubiquitin--protein ligase, partial [Escherichia coli]
MPASLKKIDASVNHLEILPDFPAENNQGRRIFWLRNNQITHIPESITGLNEISLVDLESNPLSGRTLQSLQQLMSSPDYHGPQIHFSMSDGQQHTPVRSL